MELATSAGKGNGEDIAAEIIRCFDKLKSKRGNWDSQYTEIAERIWPNQSRLFNGMGTRTQGEKRTEQLYDSTAANALNRFVSILDSLLTPANDTWHFLRPIDDYLLKDREVKIWFEELNRQLFQMRYAANSNFQAQNQLVYKMLGAYGTGSIYPDVMKDYRGKATGIRYRHVHLSEIYLECNHQGIVDTAYRYFELDARQAMQMFGREKLPASVISASASKSDQTFWFIQCVRPRDDYDPERGDHKGMPWVSYYVAEEGRMLLEESGYDTFPFPTARYEQVPGEVYGRSPAMDVLPAIKTLNEQKKTVLTQGHRAVSPVLLTHDDGIVDTFSMRPGALNSGGVTADGRPLVHALPVGSIAIGKELMDDERADIKDPFLVPLFQILTENPQMTAREVMERVKEKAILLAPTVGRQYAEYHSPLIEREVAILARLGKLPKPVPQALIEAGGQYTVRYESPMTRSQRAEEASGALSVVDMAINISAQTQNPEPLDFINWDEMVPDIADIHGMPAKWINSPDKIAAIRDQRAQAAQVEQAARVAPGTAALMKAGAKVQEAEQA